MISETLIEYHEVLCTSWFTIAVFGSWYDLRVKKAYQAASCIYKKADGLSGLHMAQERQVE